MQSRQIFFLLFTILACLFSLSINALCQDSSIFDYSLYIGKQIGEIKITGLSVVTKEEILFLIPVKVSDVLTLDNLSQIISTLYKTEYFKKVTIDLSLTMDGKVILAINVEEREIVNKIEITGNNALKKDKIEEVLLIQTGDFISDLKIKKTVEKIKNLYLDEGYEAPDIEYSVKIDENKQANITFKISEKKRYIIKSINIEGNTVIESKKILKVMQTKKQSKIIFEFNKGIYNQGKIEQDLNSIQNLYSSQGYLDVEVFVKDIKVTETEKEKDIEITISIVENEQYTLNSFAFYGNKLFDLVAFLDPKITNPGVVYNKIAIANLANRIRDYYANYGYVFAIVEVEETINYSDKKVDIVISISENSRAHIEKIIIKGNTKTKDYVIIRELMIQEGETFSTDKIRQSIYNLYNTQYFGAIDVQFQQGSDDDLVNLIIAVEEKSTGQFKFGATYSPGSDNSFGLSGSITEYKFLGLGLQISAEVTVSTNNDYLLSLSYLDKWFLGQPIQFGISLSGEISMNETYTDNNLDGEPDFDPEDLTSYNIMDYWLDEYTFSLSWGKRWIPRFSLVGYISTSLVHYHSVEGVTDTPYIPEFTFIPFVEFANGNDNYWSFTNSISLVARYDTRDYYLFPTKGYFAKLTLGYYGGFLGGDSQFTKLGIGLNYNISLFWKIVFSINSNVDFIFPQFDGQLQIGPENMLYVNGYNDIRGWKIRLSPYYGNTKGLVSFEFQREIVPQIFTVSIFSDLGYLLSQPDDILSLTWTDIVGTIGFGFKLQIPSLPFRLYFTHPFTFTSEGSLDFIKTSFWYWDITLTVGDIFTW